jgi:hypothetical protein
MATYAEVGCWDGAIYPKVGTIFRSLRRTKEHKLSAKLSRPLLISGVPDEFPDLLIDLTTN